MNFNDLKIFNAVYEEQSINKASIRLRYAQSNISQRISQIEKDLGANLLVRSNKGVFPNKEGEYFYKYSKKVLMDTAKMKKVIQLHAKTKLYSEFIFNYMIETNELSMDNENIKIATTGNLKYEIEFNDFDSVISFNKINKLQYKLEYTKVIKLMLFGANDNSDMPMFVNSDKQCPIRLLSLDVKEKSREIIEIDSLAAIINLIQSGKGIALLPIVIGKNRGLTNLSLKSYDLKYYKYIKA